MHDFLSPGPPRPQEPHHAVGRGNAIPVRVADKLNASAWPIVMGKCRSSDTASSTTQNDR